MISLLDDDDCLLGRYLKWQLILLSLKSSILIIDIVIIFHFFIFDDDWLCVRWQYQRAGTLRRARLFHYNPVKYDLGKGEVEKIDFVGLLQLKLLQLKLLQPNS